MISSPISTRPRKIGAGRCGHGPKTLLARLSSSTERAKVIMMAYSSARSTLPIWIGRISVRSIPAPAASSTKNAIRTAITGGSPNPATTR